MLINTFIDFTYYVPTATGSDWETLRPYINDAEMEIRDYFTGKDLYSYIENSGTEEIRDGLKRLICHKGYQIAIPFCDLIQTPNGFAIVSNTNLAPASMERVERLLKWCDKVISDKTDDLIIRFIQDEQLRAEWTKTDCFESYTNCLFYTGFEFASYTKNQVNARKAFLEAKNDMLVWQQNLIEPRISKDLLTEILLQLQKNTLTEDNKKIVHLCRMFLGKMFLQDNQQACKLMGNIEHVLESNLEIYTSYANSKEYALKIAPKYENKQEDPTFFFGL